MTSLPGRRFVDIYKHSLMCVPCKSSEVLSINEINTYIKTVNGQFRLLPLSDKEATANGTCHTVLPVFVLLAWLDMTLMDYKESPSISAFLSRVERPNSLGTWSLSVHGHSCHLSLVLWIWKQFNFLCKLLATTEVAPKKI